MKRSAAAAVWIHRLAFFAACLLMTALPLTHYICVSQALHVGYIAGLLYTMGALTALLLAAAYLLGTTARRPTRYEYLFGLLLVFAGLSVAFSSDPHTSFWGSPSRCEGFLMLACYYLFFYLGRLLAARLWRGRVLAVFLGVMLLHCLYGLNQQYHVLSGGVDHYYYAISGVAGNPNFMATLTVMASCTALGLLLFAHGWKTRLACAALLAVFLATMVLTKTFSAFVGLGAAFAFLVVYFLRSGNWQRQWFVLAVPAAALLVLFCLVNADFLARDFAQLGTQLADMLQGQLPDPSFASGRPYLWYTCFLLFLKSPLTGLGIDNLLNPYYEAYGLFMGQFMDRAHNELLQILVTIGLPAFIGYVVLYVFLFQDLAAQLHAENRADAGPLFALLLCLIGYLAQGFFNISVIDVAPYFWLLCGLIAPLPAPAVPQPSRGARRGQPKPRRSRAS